MNRQALLAQVSERLEGRRLVWFGTRGADVEPASDLAELGVAFSLIAAYGGRNGIDGLALEDLLGWRPDLDTFELDDHLRDPEVGELRQAMLSALSRPSAVFTYRPSTFVSAVCFSRQDRCQHLGMFKDHQQAFEHKPWVETAVAAAGIPHIPWKYIGDGDQVEALQLLDRGPVMLRRSHTNGGVGLVRIDDAADLSSNWFDEEEAYVSVAPYLSDGIPINVGAVAWRDGVTVHRPSVQLIGVPACTTRPFGYCGNDFGAAAALDTALLDSIERSVVIIGDWMRARGFLGAFGVDFLLVDGQPLFTEVNPRFQGSTHASCRLSVEADESCLLLEHLAAFLGIPAPEAREAPPIAVLARSVDPLSHLIVHHRGDEFSTVDPVPLARRLLDEPTAIATDVLGSRDRPTEPGATLLRLTVADRLTDGGFDLREPWPTLIETTVGGSGARTVDMTDEGRTG